MGFCKSLFAQSQNLIADPGFELYDSCADYICQFDTGWCSLIGSVDLYTYCDLNSDWGFENERMIPSNNAGYQFPFSGNHYVGFAVYAQSFNNVFELPAIVLNDRLIKNRKYIFEFYLSLADSNWYGSKNISVCFYNSSKLAYLPQITFGPEINMPLFREIFRPQWIYSGPYLNDKENWMKINGFFIADGTEEYMAIGNFLGDEFLDTIFTPPVSYAYIYGSNDYYYKSVYYYLDNVSLWEDTTYIGIEQPDFEQSKVFISENGLNIYLSNHASPLSIEIYDATGRQVFTTPITQRESHFPMPQLSQGVYSYGLVYKDRIVKRGKLVF